MEHDDQVPSTIETSSSKKKKSKKDKKRKHDDDDVASPSPMKNGSKNGKSSSSSKKKKKKDKKKKVKAINNDGVDNTSSVEQEQAEVLTPPSAEEDEITEQISSSQKKSQTTSSTTTTTAPPGSIFSLVTKPSSKQLKNKKSSSPYQIKTIMGTVALLPTSLPDVPKCIQSLLHSLLLMYDANMGGVLLSLEEGVKLLPIDNNHKASSSSGGSSTGLIGGKIMDDLPYIHYKFQFKGLLFCPSLGMKLQGQVVECTPTYITLTTHHILSTKISTESLHGVGFFYNSGSMEWTRERDGGNEDGRGGEEDDVLGPSTSIYLDDLVEFVVERIHECGGYISLDGMRPSVSTLGL